MNVKTALLLLLITSFCYSQSYTLKELDLRYDQLKDSGNSEGAIDLNLKALQHFKKTNNKEGIVTVMINIGDQLSVLTKYKENIEYLDQAKSELGGIKNPLLEARLLAAYGRNYSLLGFPEQSLTNFNNAIKFINKISDPKEKHDLLFYTYGWKWYNFEVLNDIDSVYSMQKKSLELKPEPYVYIKIANRFLRQNKQLDSAEYYLNKAGLLNKKNDINIKASILFNFGGLHVLRNENDKALDYYFKYLEINKKIKRNDYVRNAYLEISNVYKSMGDEQNTEKYYKNYSYLNDSINDNEKKILHVIVNKLAKEKETSEKSKNNLYILMSAIVLISIALLYLLYQIYLKRQRKKDELIEQKDELIEEKSSESDILKKKLNTSINKVTQLARNRDPFFLTSFKKLYPEFYEKLIVVNPDLTDNEIKLCAYLKLNLNTKEIVQFENITARSVETKKYRLKKKLGLASEDSLIKWLSEL